MTTQTLPTSLIVNPRMVSRMFCFTVLIVVSLRAGSPGVHGQDPPAAIVTELTPDNWDQMAPRGKEADAIYGDFVMRNDHITAVIARPGHRRHANMTVRDVGGCLIDLEANNSSGDQLSAFYPGRKVQAYTSARILTAGEPTPGVPPSNPGELESAARVEVLAPGSETAPEHRTVWILRPGAKHLEIVSCWRNTTPSDITLTPEDAIRADGGKEWMNKSPNGDHTLFCIEDTFWQQAYGVFAGAGLRSNSNPRESVLSYAPSPGSSFVVPPGGMATVRRCAFVARDLPAVRAQHAVEVSSAAGLLALSLSAEVDGSPVAGARFTLSDSAGKLGTVTVDASGMAAVRLAQGTYSAKVSIDGVERGTHVFEVRPDQPAIVFESNDVHRGRAVVRVVDETGRPIPAKIEFRTNGEQPTPNWGPESAEFFVGNVAYTASGTVETPLDAGPYDLIVSHGSEFDASFTKLIVHPGQVAELTVPLRRSVQTPGWISADYHSHSTPSGDNTSSQLGRVLNLLAEHIEFAPCTEHNRISSYDAHLARLQASDRMATVSGMELTGQPLPLNHQNVFPLVMHPRTQDGGAPVTDLSPETQMERIAAWDNNSTKLIQQNHPDIGWLFFDRDGNQQPDEGYSRSFGLMNVMEIHPIDPLLNPTPLEIRDGKPVGNQTALNWLQLLNQGFRIYGVVNTDSHYNLHGSGGLRLWVKSSTDDPAAVSLDELRDNSRNGHLIMSNGPYLEASFREAGSRDAGSTAGEVIAGQDLVVKSGKVTASIRVQCPNWIDIDVVHVLVNGRRSEALTFTRETHPAWFHAGAVKFEQEVPIELTADAHLIVLAGHRTQTLGDVQGPFWGAQHPAVLNNPVFVDVDGDGFTANRDTLDVPLPVKFVAP